MTWWHVVLSIVGASLLLWSAMVATLLFTGRRDGKSGRLREALRLLPDLVRLLHRLARDSDLPRGARVRLWLLLAYLAMPIDLVPDFVPVIGYADDVVIIAVVLRSVVRRAGPEVLERHWPGTADGLRVVRRLTQPSAP
jgi:uncharacterized membrane protein YkvA (DUF1232 family)